MVTQDHNPLAAFVQRANAPGGPGVDPGNVDTVKRSNPFPEDEDSGPGAVVATRDAGEVEVAGPDAVEDLDTDVEEDDDEEDGLPARRGWRARAAAGDLGSDEGVRAFADGMLSWRAPTVGEIFVSHADAVQAARWRATKWIRGIYAVPATFVQLVGLVIVRIVGNAKVVCALVVVYLVWKVIELSGGFGL